MINKTNQIEAVRNFTKSIQSRVIAVGIMLVIFATSVFAAFSVSYTVDIVDDGQALPTVTTTRSEPMDILNQADLSMDAHDKIDLSEFESGKGGKIIVHRSKEISIEYCNQLSNYEVYATTVADAIQEVGITLEEGTEVNFDLKEKVMDGMVISIVIPNPVTINVDGQSKAAIATESTVADFIAAQGIALGEQDIIEPALDSQVSANMVIAIQRVSYAELTEVHGIPFATVTKRNAALPAGTTQIQQAGVNGEKEVRFQVRLVDGVETERTVIGETVTVPAVNQIVVNGTQSVPAITRTEPVADTVLVSNPSRTYKGIAEGQIIGGRATHYCACATCNGSNSGNTASGMKIYNGMANPYIVACNWLPLGTKIKVNGVLYTVADRGGSGFNYVGRVDIFTPGGHAECYRLGSPSITIEIVQLSKTN